MADKKTSQEDAASALDGTELVRVVQGGASKRTTAQAIARVTSYVLPRVLTENIIVGDNQAVVVVEEVDLNGFSITLGTNAALGIVS